MRDLPAYSPNLNPTERLGKGLKGLVIHNAFHAHVDEIRSSVHEFLALSRRYPRKCGVAFVGNRTKPARTYIGLAVIARSPASDRGPPFGRGAVAWGSRGPRARWAFAPNRAVPGKRRLDYVLATGQDRELPLQIVRPAHGERRLQDTELAADARFAESGAR